jgi:hypothetical protein
MQRALHDLTSEYYSVNKKSDFNGINKSKKLKRESNTNVLREFLNVVEHSWFFDGFSRIKWFFWGNASVAEKHAPMHQGAAATILSLHQAEISDSA